MVSIDTERLHLRELHREHDAASMLALLNDPAFMVGIADHGVRTVEQAMDHLRGWAGAQYRRYGFGHYAVELRQSGIFIGTCGLIQRADLLLADIGYGFLSAHHGRGYAEEAARAVIAHARDVLGMRGLCGIVATDNNASLRLMEKLGLRRSGEYRMASEARPLAYYEIAF